MGPNWRMSIIMQDKLIPYQLICHITYLILQGLYGTD